MPKKKKFYKKETSKDESKKLPKNYRNITDNVHSDHAVFFTGFFCITLALIVVGFDFYSNYSTKKQLEAEKIKVSRELNYWQSEVREKPNFRDGYFSLALIYYQLKDFKSSSEYLEKAMVLDPNFEKGNELRKLIEEK